MESNSTGVHERIKYLREDILNIKQNEMSLKIGLKQGSLSDIERKKTKVVTDRVINDICREFNVSENWMRTGKGDMFEAPSSITLDEYAKQNNLSDIEMRLIKSYMSIDKDIRMVLLESLEQSFNSNSEIAVSEEEATYGVDNIDQEVEAYRLELEAEKKGIILSASEDGKKIG